jgi:hypothetical protein
MMFGHGGSPHMGLEDVLAVEVGLKASERQTGDRLHPMSARIKGIQFFKIEMHNPAKLDSADQSFRGLTGLACKGDKFLDEWPSPRWRESRVKNLGICARITKGKQPMPNM